MSSLLQQSPARPLILDCDGVLLNWLGGFTRFAESYLGRPMPTENSNEYDLGIRFGVDHGKIVEMIQIFNSGEGGYFAQLEPLPGAREALEAAHAAGRPLHVVSSCSTLPAVVSGREENLRRDFGDIFDEILCLDPSASKAETLSAFPTGSWVEDNFQNAVVGATVGHTTYLIRQSYNIEYEPDSDHPGLTWVDGWGCIQHHENLHRSAA